MIDLKGMISVVEAARRLNRSTEQVRRYLREGKLRGQRIGNQWFVEEACLEEQAPRSSEGPKPLIPPELTARVRQIRREILERNGGQTFDGVEMLREHRESD